LPSALLVLLALILLLPLRTLLLLPPLVLLLFIFVLLPGIDRNSNPQKQEQDPCSYELHGNTSVMACHGIDRLRLGSSTQQPLMACARNPMQIGLSKSVEEVKRELDSDNAVIPQDLSDASPLHL
jgi:hypothetical protein